MKNPFTWVKIRIGKFLLSRVDERDEIVFKNLDALSQTFVETTSKISIEHFRVLQTLEKIELRLDELEKGLHNESED
jgi:hypothetical protein